MALILQVAIIIAKTFVYFYLNFPIVNAFMELVEAIFQMDGVKFFLSERISQDPLERFFGVQRQRGRVNENPDVATFCKNTQAIKVIGSFCRGPVKGNCRGIKRKSTLTMNPCQREELLETTR
jgi:hypothetical protein